MAVRLTPGGHLRWEPGPDTNGAAVPADLAPVLEAFGSDWRGALFTLAAERLPAQDFPSLRYWQQLAEHYLAGLCHLPADAERVAVEPPGDGLLATWVLNAPPMEGGEYLSPDCLRGLWERFDEWVREAAAAAGGPGALLRQRAPRWRQVGRVCFHLAENRNDEERPFAFLATYASRLRSRRPAQASAAPQRPAAVRRGQQPYGADQPAGAGRAGGQGVRVGARADGLRRPVSPAGLAARGCLPVPAERAGAGVERALGAGAQLVAQAVAAAGVGHDRYPDTATGGCRRGAGLQGGDRARRQRSVG